MDGANPALTPHGKHLIATAIRLMSILEREAGRLLFNGFPTGVEVADAMAHAGPRPISNEENGT